MTPPTEAERLLGQLDKQLSGLADRLSEGTEAGWGAVYFPLRHALDALLAAVRAEAVAEVEEEARQSHGAAKVRLLNVATRLRAAALREGGR